VNELFVELLDQMVTTGDAARRLKEALEYFGSFPLGIAGLAFVALSSRNFWAKPKAKLPNHIFVVQV
jgi:hypothetical protein